MPPSGAPRSWRLPGSAGSADVLRTLGIVALLTFATPHTAHRLPLPQDRDAATIAADLENADPAVRARAACELRELGSAAAAALPLLVKLLADGSPLDPTVCERRWWRGGETDLTSPGELAASALVAIGSPSVTPLIETLSSQSWIARRNAAWALGALDDSRASSALAARLKDDEARVREQAAWALGALDAGESAPALAGALKDPDAKVRSQAAWALGAIDGRDGVPGLIRTLRDPSARVRQQSAWALGAIGDSRALDDLMHALKDPEPGVRRQAAWAIGVIGR